MASSGIDKAPLPPTDLRLRLYHAWVAIWNAEETNHFDPDSVYLNVEELGQFFRDGEIHKLTDTRMLRTLVIAFKHHVANGNITLGGEVPASCEITNILSQMYNPQTDCTCDGFFPVLDGIDEKVVKRCGCKAISAMLQAKDEVNARQDEWDSKGIFTADKLEKAVDGLIHMNASQQPRPSTCQGSAIESIINAPDRRPNKEDSNPAIYNVMFPTLENIKLFADAKHFFVMAAGASCIDPGLLYAIADAGNDVLIGDYCEAADPATLTLLQNTGGAAMSFLKMCHLGGILSDWQFNNLVASVIQFRVVGYYRNHARDQLRDGVYGSHMTGFTVHRHIDSAIFLGVMSASLATGEEMTEAQYMKTSEVCTLINDMIDLRSDAMRKQRENVVLRSFSTTSACKHLHDLICRLLTLAREVIRETETGALVIMAFCNWAFMASHHKLFELVNHVQTVEGVPRCYNWDDHDDWYCELLSALESYGTLGGRGPSFDENRAELDQMYHVICGNPKAHRKWLADVTRCLLEPYHLHLIADVVHYQWTGPVGDVEYCP